MNAHTEKNHIRLFRDPLDPREASSLFSHEHTEPSPTSGTGDICENYHGGNPYSKQANPSQSAKQSEQSRILEVLKDRYVPLTCEQLEEKTGLSHQSCSARITDLKRAGKITIAGTGTTKSGRNAAAYLIL